MTHADAPYDLTIVAAGGLVWRHSRDGPQLAVVHRTRYDGDWTLPKGKVQPGEDPEAAALREVREETGWQARVDGWAGSIRYSVERGPKLVLFWHMTATTGRLESNDETDELDWLSPEAAQARLTHPLERDLVATVRPPGPEIAAPPRYWRLLVGDSSRAASQRLTAAVENFEADFEYRLGTEPEPGAKPWEHAIRTGLAAVREHQRLGQIDTAWRRFTAVARQDLARASKAELLARADALRHEAAEGKLASAWRSNTVAELLDAGKLPDELEDLRWQVAEATRIRDEDADNRYYRVALIRGQRTLLLIGLVFVIAALVALTAVVDWSGDVADPSPGFVALVIFFGGLGACLSAIQSLGRLGVRGRIPEHIASSVVTITRPVLGAAAALGVYAIAASGIFNITVEGERAHLTVLALAFAAGFSERLVISAVGAATGSADQKPAA